MPVVKPATIRTVLTLIVGKRLPARQLDVSNAFLHGHLDERVLCQQPIGFVDPDQPDAVCLLSRSLYGLRQAPRAWFTRIAGFLRSIGFVATRLDSSLFVLRRGSDTAFLLLYVDDMVLNTSTDKLLQDIIARLQNEFAVKDMGPLHYFLGVDVQRRNTGFLLSQTKYTEELLDRAGMVHCKPAATPIDTKAKLSVSSGAAVRDPSEYRSIAGVLQYLMITRPDIAYAVQQTRLHMHDPRECHLAIIKRILRYVRGTLSFGLHLHGTTTPTITAYSDTDWAGCPDTWRSTSGYCIYLGNVLVSWSSKRQATVSHSSAEAEYRAMANAVAECIWLRQPLRELHVVIPRATIAYCDNVSAIYMSKNPVHHRCTKHIKLDIHFICERVHVPTDQQFADVITKGLPTATFTAF
jgi:hypothetical protein